MKIAEYNLQEKNDDFSIAASWGIVVVACPNPRPKCALRGYIANNPTIAKIISVPGTNATTLRTLGETEEIADKTPDLYKRAKKICEMCMKSQSRQLAVRQK